MRIVVHDYPGHQCALSLSRALARRGHEVLHLFSSTFVGPRGDLVARADDAKTLKVEGISLASGAFDKMNLYARWKADREHGRLAARRVAGYRPDYVITANTPLDAVKEIQRTTHGGGAKHLFWVQDLIGVAADKIMRHKIPVVGGAIGKAWVNYEQRLLKKADQIVMISEDFRPFVPAESSRVHTIENWSPIGDIPLRNKVNSWSSRHGLDQTTNWVYTGTLGMKHNPGLLLRLAEEHRDDPAFRLVVVSEGVSVDWLREHASVKGLDNMVLLPFQPAADLPDVLGAADVLVGILEPSAGVFSVPSKVLSYLCAHRAILLAVPPENLIAKIVVGNDAGLAVSPLDEKAFVCASKELAANPERRQAMGVNGRQYAERTFDLDSITDRFEAIFNA